jgi:hypothetical protein
MPSVSGKKKRPPLKCEGRLRIELPFEDALKAALEVRRKKKAESGNA